MFKRAILIIVMVIAQLMGIAQEELHRADSSLAMMYEVGLNNGRSIQVGTHIDTIIDLCESRNGYYSLRKGTFGYADSIVVDVNETHQVIKTTYYYPDTLLYDDLFSSFAQHIEGAYAVLEQNEHEQSVRWQDSKIMFTLREKTTSKGVTVFSEIELIE